MTLRLAQVRRPDSCLPAPQNAAPGLTTLRALRATSAVNHCGFESLSAAAAGAGNELRLAARRRASACGLSSIRTNALLALAIDQPMQEPGLSRHPPVVGLAAPDVRVQIGQRPNAHRLDGGDLRESLDLTLRETDVGTEADHEREAISDRSVAQIGPAAGALWHRPTIHVEGQRISLPCSGH